MKCIYKWSVLTVECVVLSFFVFFIVSFCVICISLRFCVFFVFDICVVLDFVFSDWLRRVSPK